MSTAPATRREAPRATAHRGDVERHRENTIPAVRSAVEAGADFIEVDVRVTRDGHVVLLHDATLERLWGDDRPVSELDWAEVAALGDSQHRVPLLTDALPVVAGTSSTLLIDLGTPQIAESAVRVVLGSGASVAWCGDFEAMTVVRALDPEASIWMPWDRRDVPSAEFLARLRPDVINSEYLVLSDEIVDAVHRAGLRVACWTVDDEDAMRWSLARGVDVVTTNRLSLFRTVVAEGPASWEQAPRPVRLTGDELVEAIAVARELADWANDFTRNADLGDVRTKANAADHVTAVDLAVERHVREVIAERLPGHLVVGEELGGAARPGVPCWYVDPVDGTANLANGVPWTAFSLALAIDREPFVAVVGDVWRGQVFAAVAGRGAELDGQPLDLRTSIGSTDVGLAGKIVSTELLNHSPWPGMDLFLDGLRDQFCTLRVMGSGTLTLAGPAAGRGVGAVIERFSPIDHLAAALVVREAGGILLDDNGDETVWPESGGILAARPEHAPELYKLWTVARRTGV
ncbi:inositol monophosphatase family protein [Kribbella kalugense]|uniref:Deoxyribonuclease-2 n=1 Tax=Kribbella kalugense TaxID=2512221 RepID=A0A4R7ZQ97_9ACTN|nr:inositol monophosphatase family protein [Kribbella kalugense]TDW19576.1 deoxyribonuclease-2 [Kribbella kalugense]